MTRYARIRAICAAALVLVPTLALAQDTTGVGAIAGRVLDPAGAPAAGVRICALDTAQCVTSAADGTFRISGLRAGAYRLEVLPLEGLPFVSDPVEVRAGLDGTVEVDLPKVEAIEQTVTVTAPAFTAPEEVKNSGFLVAPREVLKNAGALQDVSRYVQSLPGVVIGTNDFRNDIIVRGGSPLENLFVVDNIEIPNINSFANFASAGGTVSILDAELLQDVTFLTGGYPAPYINRTSSVLQVTQREGSRTGFGGWATLGFAGAGTILEGPINGGRGSWIVSARRSFLDLVTDDIGVGGVPVLYTLNAKAVYDLTPRDRVWMVNISGRDNIRLGYREGQEAEDGELSTLDIRYDGWRAATGVNWQRLFGSRGVGLLGVTHSEAKVGQRVKDLALEGLPPTGPADEAIAAAPTVYFEDSREGETTFKYDLTLNVPGLDKIQAGGSFKIFRIDYQAESPYGNDTPFSPVTGVDPFFLTTGFRAYQTGAYVQATRALTQRASVTAGLRVDDYDFLNETRVSPRLGATYRLGESLSWNASYGRYYQQPAFLFLAAFPENRGAVPWRADHYVTGLAWTPSPDLRATLEVYGKRYADYPVAATLPSVSLANIGDTFNVREILFPLASAGRGRAYGVELFVEKRLTSKLYGQGNLAFSRTRHAALDGVLRPGSFDYPFVFNLTGGYRVSPAWEISSRVALLGGRPYTPFDEAASAAGRRGVYDLSRVNAERGPMYARIDVRVDRTFTVGGQPLNVFLGVQNIANRKNFGGYLWNRRANALDVNEQQGLFPILGFDWRF
ncbi:MAG: TonB-dependent receptor [Acidobacteria bacterium]|nr:TonB-dependent receptor [Acidobacteriota bacterium]